MDVKQSAIQCLPKHTPNLKTVVVGHLSSMETIPEEVLASTLTANLQLKRDGEFQVWFDDDDANGAQFKA